MKPYLYFIHSRESWIDEEAQILSERFTGTHNVYWIRVNEFQGAEDQLPHFSYDDTVICVGNKELAYQLESLNTSANVAYWDLNDLNNLPKALVDLVNRNPQDNTLDLVKYNTYSLVI